MEKDREADIARLKKAERRLAADVEAEHLRERRGHVAEPFCTAAPEPGGLTSPFAAHGHPRPRGCHAADPLRRAGAPRAAMGRGGGAGESAGSERSEGSTGFGSYRSSSCGDGDLARLRVAPLDEPPPASPAAAGAAAAGGKGRGGRDGGRVNLDEMEAASARLQEMEERLAGLPDGLLDELVLRRKAGAGARSESPGDRLSESPADRQSSQVRWTSGGGMTSGK